MNSGHGLSRGSNSADLVVNLGKLNAVWAISFNFLSVTICVQMCRMILGMACAMSSNRTTQEWKSCVEA